MGQPVSNVLGMTRMDLTVIKVSLFDISREV